MLPASVNSRKLITQSNFDHKMHIRLKYDCIQYKLVSVKTSIVYQSYYIYILTGLQERHISMTLHSARFQSHPGMTASFCGP